MESFFKDIFGQFPLLLALGPVLQPQVEAEHRHPGAQRHREQGEEDGQKGYPEIWGHMTRHVEIVSQQEMKRPHRPTP